MRHQERSRKRGRPKQKWMKAIYKLERGTIIVNLTEEMVLNISKWKEMIHVKDPKYKGHCYSF